MEQLGCLIVEKWDNPLKSANRVDQVKALDFLVGQPSTEFLNIETQLLIKLMHAIWLRWQRNARLSLALAKATFKRLGNVNCLLKSLTMCGDPKLNHDLEGDPNSDEVS